MEVYVYIHIYKWTYFDFPSHQLTSACIALALSAKFEMFVFNMLSFFFNLNLAGSTIGTRAKYATAKLKANTLIPLGLLLLPGTYV